MLRRRRSSDIPRDGPPLRLAPSFALPPLSRCALFFARVLTLSCHRLSASLPYHGYTTTTHAPTARATTQRPHHGDDGTTDNTAHAPATTLRQDVPPRATPPPSPGLCLLTHTASGRSCRGARADLTAPPDTYDVTAQQRTRLPRTRRQHPGTVTPTTRHDVTRGAQAKHCGAPTLPHDTPAQRHWGTAQSTIVPPHRWSTPWSHQPTTNGQRDTPQPDRVLTMTRGGAYRHYPTYSISPSLHRVSAQFSSF